VLYVLKINRMPNDSMWNTILMWVTEQCRWVPTRQVITCQWGENKVMVVISLNKRCKLLRISANGRTTEFLMHFISKSGDMCFSECRLCDEGIQYGLPLTFKGKSRFVINNIVNVIIRFTVEATMMTHPQGWSARLKNSKFGMVLTKNKRTIQLQVKKFF
jgi:hypothetical protein